MRPLEGIIVGILISRPVKGIIVGILLLRPLKMIMVGILILRPLKGIRVGILILRPLTGRGLSMFWCTRVHVPAIYHPLICYRTVGTHYTSVDIQNPACKGIRHLGS